MNRRANIGFFMVLLAAILLLSGFAQAQSLFTKDIYPGSGSSNPWPFADLNGVGYFPAGDGTGNPKFYRSDGTTAGTSRVKDVALVGGIRSINGTLYFWGTVSNTNSLWKSNGTTSGTVVVKSNLSPHSFTLSGGNIFFINQIVSKRVSRISYELWKTNGTGTGTVRITTMDYISLIADANGFLFFRQDNGISGLEPWRSDGTKTGTVMIKDINPGAAGSGYTGTPAPPWNGYRFDFNSWPAYLSYGNSGSFYFGANDGTNGNQLWKSDGTSAGTVRVTSGGANGNFTPHWLCQIGDKAYFSADDGEHGFELWALDLSTMNYSMVCDLRTGSSGSYPMWLTALGTTLYFSANDGSSGHELWKYDGTNPPVLVADINPGGSSYPNGFRPPNSWMAPFIASRNGILYFHANDGTHGYELWQSDGTASGTSMVADINPSGSSISTSGPPMATLIGDKLFFGADDGTYGTELWVLNNLPKRANDEWQEDESTPGTASLSQNYPNPFNPSTTIGYSLPVDARVKLRVYDALGREVATLVNDAMPAGYHTVPFNAKDLPSGVYLYRLEVSGQVFMRLMTLAK